MEAFPIEITPGPDGITWFTTQSADEIVAIALRTPWDRRRAFCRLKLAR